jgi:hypothetical protein
MLDRSLDNNVINDIGKRSFSLGGDMGHVAGVSGAICGKVVIGDFPIKPVVLLKPDADALIHIDDCLHPPPGRSSCPEESPSPVSRPRRPRLLTPLKRPCLGYRWPGRQQCLGSAPRPPTPDPPPHRSQPLLGGDGRVPDGQHTAARMAILVLHRPPGCNRLEDASSDPIRDVWGFRWPRSATGALTTLSVSMELSSAEAHVGARGHGRASRSSWRRRWYLLGPATCAIQVHADVSAR